jgi:hypothetical protein
LEVGMDYLLGIHEDDLGIQYLGIHQIRKAGRRR